MKRLKEILNSKTGLRILDVGTGAGGFIYSISELANEYDEIIGIDTSEGAIEAAKKNFEDARISFLKMDALSMSFEDGVFDIVCLSNSLHHLKDINKTISEMERVLKPDGFLLFNEMFSDVEEQKQLTHVEMHHFWAEIDRLNNVTHNETFKRQEIINTLNENSNLSVDEAWNMSYEKEQELTKESYDWLNNTIERSLDRVKDSDQYDYFKEKAEVLKERLVNIGFKSATQLLVVMK
ncbi:class I SAM-dependent methyltransferase [Mycoplasmatota bacterium WC44]